MTKARSRNATGEWRIVSVALVSALVASCSSTGDPTFNLADPALSGASAGASVAADTAPAEDASKLVMSSEGTTALPETVAYVPAVKPGSAFPDFSGAQTTAPATAAPTNPTESKSQAAQAAASDAQAQSAAAAVADDSPKSDSQKTGAKAAAVAVPADYPVYVTATDPNQPRPEAPKKRGFFQSLFGATPANATPLIKPESQRGGEPLIEMQAKAKPVIAPEPSPKPVLMLASTGGEKAEVQAASLGGNGATERLDALPGVRQSSLFEIKRKSGLNDDDSDVDLHEEEDYGPVRVATAAGMARLAPNGLITQTDQVDVACLKPSLVRMLKTVEQHYGKRLVVTSGYRDPQHNQRARGARNSLHMYCAAADVQVPGVSRWELATFIRSMPGRGGVGTYCHTESVHIDVGPERDWNWRCRRRNS
ncbi:YcbK family protein [Mesorhizobium sp. BAC0120]|uniref:YcbK family protein n=1 Tax=Mesorhizobium sp. BAC0120 TaxID=3090670 RepID=UPI00298D1901|nr:YcbK family protein [Mesorhizobium sp. BAC0120]MDW6023919.1 YcbK family protein [Mesorhizobium sp. BAC0120]